MLRLSVGVCLLLLLVSLRADPSSSKKLVEAARSQVGKTLLYDPAYVSLKYPGGDVPLERGVCTDVVVRAYRALGIDLQKEVHEDMRRNFHRYPQNWGLKKADHNIDHRRVPNLMTYFQRKKRSLPISLEPKSYLPGDVVTWKLGGGRLHIGIVSDRKTSEGVPLILHNIGRGAQEEDLLFELEIAGHYRSFR